MREEEPFISLLVQKLKRVKRDQEVREKLEHALQQFREFRSRLSARKSQKKVHWDKKLEGQLLRGNEASRDAGATVVGYSFGPHSVPFMSRVRGKPMSTLADFKTLFNRKGCYRYFFKKYSNEFGTKIVFEEVTHDLETLPLWDGKVFAIVEEMDNV